MKVISIWQPWASLIIHGHKVIETRGWPAPQRLIGQRIGIAATKTVKAPQLVAAADPVFAAFYAETGLPPLIDLPRGAILGTVTLDECVPINHELVEDITEAERAFGWFDPGRFAWRIGCPMAYEFPIGARGMQGLWDYDEEEGSREATENLGEARP